MGNDRPNWDTQPDANNRTALRNLYTFIVIGAEFDAAKWRDPDLLSVHFDGVDGRAISHLTVGLSDLSRAPAI
jgi:hypothetical protein